MDQAGVADILEEIGVLLEIKGENPFKCRAYLNGARVVGSLTEDLGVLVAEGRLGEVKGLGKALQEKVSLLVRDGRLPFYEELKASLPPGLPNLMEIPGMGPKKVKAVYQELGVESVEDLEVACREGKVAKLSGMGKKTEAKILEGIEQVRKYANQHRLGAVLGLAEDLVERLREHPAVVRVELAGSLRRRKEVVKDIDVVASVVKGEAGVLMNDFTEMEGVEKVVVKGETKTSVLLQGGVGCDLRVVEDFQFPYVLHHFTGSKEHNVVMRQRAIERGMKLSEWGLFRGDEEELVKCVDENAIFRELGLGYIPPELRENMGEFEVADLDGERGGKVPRLVEWSDLRGAFHNHTVASDGRNSLEEMAAAAEAIGLEYLGIADHSKSSVQANGLSEERLMEQAGAIHDFNERGALDVKLLAGVECDVLKDGSLDYGDDILGELDYVVASVHGSFSLSEADMTKRIIRAMENEYVTMMGHLTGRLLLKRDAYAVNVLKVLDAAVATGTWIELNASPYRLDMDWRWWRVARDRGVKCVVNADAHSVEQLGYLKLGVEVGRKGWLRKEDVVNCLGWDEIKKL